MANLPLPFAGTTLGSAISNQEIGDTWATHYSHLGVGGFIELPDITYRNDIPIDSGEQMDSDGLTSGKRKLGMIVYLIDTKKYYQLRPKNPSTGLEITLSEWNAKNTAQKLVILKPDATVFDGEETFDNVTGTGNADDAWVEIFKPFTVSGNTNNNVLTATGLDDVILGESKLTFDGTTLSVDGEVHASAFYQTSSRTFKTNIEPFNISGIDLLNDVNIVTFNYLNDLDNQHIGFIAEDTPTELSTKNQNVMDTNSTIGVLIKAVQELTNKVKELESKIK